MGRAKVPSQKRQNLYIFVRKWRRLGTPAELNADRTGFGLANIKPEYMT